MMVVRKMLTMRGDAALRRLGWRRRWYNTHSLHHAITFAASNAHAIHATVSAVCQARRVALLSHSHCCEAYEKERLMHKIKNALCPCA
jgi:hypothetical protein